MYGDQPIRTSYVSSKREINPYNVMLGFGHCSKVLGGNLSYTFMLLSEGSFWTDAKPKFFLWLPSLPSIVPEMPAK